ncbi:MAG: methyl-accepting chemotaxis protein [Casimicrobiaceae bacterium]|nr:methyl-accepting chemotaxis protein [Casimicrobiaceae bacterium]MCX8098409.1 methyl-accepting chemotaxis protein [Casimicrobiaceae bacterium]MDW8311121.1 methyl-accepting chemotaxis protein [Burkholderiales bacterium]
MKLKLGTLFGRRQTQPEASARSAQQGPLTVAAAPEPGYDPNATVAVMERMRAAVAGAAPVRKLPLIGHLPTARQYQILGVALATFFVLMLVSFGLYVLEARRSNAQISASIELQTLSQGLVLGAAQAESGVQSAFPLLRTSRDSFSGILRALLQGGDYAGVKLVEPQNQAVRDAVEKVNQRWSAVETKVNEVLSAEDVFRTLAQAVARVNEGNQTLLELSEQLATQIGGGREGALAGTLVMLTQRIAKNANALLGSEVSSDVAFLLGKDTATFRDIINGLLQGSDALRIAPVRDSAARQTLTELAAKFEDSEPALVRVLRAMPRLLAGKQAARAVIQDGEPLLAATRELTSIYQGEGDASYIPIVLAVLFGLLTLLTAVLIGLLFVGEARERALESERENQRNQEAILRLLNEMGTLADGDLTVRASVTEDVTGAIADSINFTVEELRKLVLGINATTANVASATQSAQALSQRLYQASQRQSEEIQRASARVLQMAQSISEVSNAATQGAAVAQQSLAAAQRGVAAVQNQIAGMNEIRAQIQESAKRIKRLGESSQEIGEIVELISDITEQTNVLALNAAIQAASAGEAGRGFTVVAEEVQRLAERSAQATRQIEALVRTIQTDTQDAVSAMERTTQGVVEGTRLSDAAGQALEEIARVSQELAEIVHNISNQAQSQAASVTEVTRGMQDILAVTEETARGTQQSNKAIEELARLAQSLRMSVAGFKV